MAGCRTDNSVKFQYVGSWVIVTLLCMAAGLQITLLNMSLRFYESLWVPDDDKRPGNVRI